LQRDLWICHPGAGQGEPDARDRAGRLGMNDVLNAQGYTQAAWWNRIPAAAWILNVGDRRVLQRAGRLPRAQLQAGSRRCSWSCRCRVDLVLSHRRHRQPARRPDPRGSQNLVALAVSLRAP